MLHTYESEIDNSSDIVAHGTPRISTKSSDKLPKKAFVELAQEELKSRQTTEEMLTYSDSR